MLNLDTHIVIFFVAQELDQTEYLCMENQQLVISDIVLWELAKLSEAKRLKMDLCDVVFQSFLRSITVIPVNMEIARVSTRLDFSSDPADEIIAATSVVEKIPLLTRDRKILRSRMVPFAPARIGHSR